MGAELTVEALEAHTRRIDQRVEKLEREREGFRDATGEMRAARGELHEAVQEVRGLATRIAELGKDREYHDKHIGVLFERTEALDGRVRTLETDHNHTRLTANRNSQNWELRSDTRRRIWIAAVGGGLAGAIGMGVSWFLSAVGAG